MIELFKNHEILVEENSSGEIFITRLSSSAVTVRMRVTPIGNNHLKVTAHDNLITPSESNGLAAIIIWGNRWSVEA